MSMPNYVVDKLYLLDFLVDGTNKNFDFSNYNLQNMKIQDGVNDTDPVSFGQYNLRFSNYENSIQSNTTAIQNETQRATDAENNLQGQITTETQRATGSENNLQGQITTETQRATDAETSLVNNIKNLTNTVQSFINLFNNGVVIVDSNGLPNGLTVSK